MFAFRLSRKASSGGIMKLKHILALSLGMTVATLGAAQAETVKIGSIAEYQPYNYLDDEGEMQGFEAGFAGLLCMQASITCEWVLAPAEDLISNLQTYEFDIIISAMEISAANMVYINFSDEYLPAGTSSTGGTILTHAVGIGINPSNLVMLDNLNAAIAAIKADGSLDTLIAAWFDGLDPEYRNIE
jgi:ABC-type amino acid transport substrate-binding protein